MGTANALAPLRLARYEIRLRAGDPLTLPLYKGSTFRGALGHALKRVVCAMDHRDCARCLLREQCVYSVCFESPTPLDATALRRNSHRPHPFVLEPPLESKRDYSPGEWLTLGLVLRFLTPTRLKMGGCLTDRVEFGPLFSRLLDRLSSLARFYCGAALTLDFRAEKVAAQAVRTVEDRLEWRDWERYSARQDTRMRLGGVVGEVMYEGQLGRFLPFLRLGEQVHVGNGTAFGLGAFRIVLHEP